MHGLGLKKKKSFFSVIDYHETKMMNLRWRFFHFTHQFSLQDQKIVNSCGHCFAKLLLTHTRDETLKNVTF